MPVGVASCDANIPLALYSNDKLRDKKRSAGLYGLNSNEDSSPRVFGFHGITSENKNLCADILMPPKL